LSLLGADNLWDLGNLQCRWKGSLNLLCSLVISHDKSVQVLLGAELELCDVGVGVLWLEDNNLLGVSVSGVHQELLNLENLFWHCVRVYYECLFVFASLFFSNFY